MRYTPLPTQSSLPQESITVMLENMRAEYHLGKSHTLVAAGDDLLEEAERHRDAENHDEVVRLAEKAGRLYRKATRHAGIAGSIYGRLTN